jgi:hypothetical protein
MTGGSRELVVARHHEDLRWLKRVPGRFRVTVYDKSRELPNIGREAHTYLHHIVTRYGDLADVTVFCQGKPFDHAFDFHKTLRGIAECRLPISEFRWLGHTIDRDDRDGAQLFRKWSKNPDGRALDMNSFFRAVWNQPAPDSFTFYPGANFAVTAETIRRRSRDFYTNALRIAAEFPDAAHCFERTWDCVFGVAGIPAEHMGKAMPVYFKQIRQLRVETTRRTASDTPPPR